MKNIIHSYFGKLFILFFLICLAKTHAQEAKDNFWDHVRFGGGIGLSFGDGYFSGSLAPSAIYQFNEQFAAGVGFNVTYASFNNDTNATILGGSVIGLYNVLPQIQLSAEFEELNVNRKYKFNGSPDITRNYWSPALFVGAGFRSNNFTIGIRYDVFYDNEESIYVTPFAPFVRVYF